MPHQLRLFDPAEPPRSPGEVRVARGALAAEGMLLARLDELAAEARKNPAVLAKPVRIVVPSRSLRLHLGNAIVRHRGRSVAGVTIQTLHAVAFEVLERAGEPAPAGMPLFDVVAQRAARSERILRLGLGDLVDGYAAVAGTVRDLLDAGFEPALFDAVNEALASDGPRAAGAAEVERARALVRVAAHTETVMREIGLGRVSTLLRRAVELLAADPERALPSRALLIHGFADATGVATDFLQALLRRGAVLILDQPPDPAGGGGSERAFTARFTERLGSVSRFIPAAPVSQDGGGEAAPQVQRFDAVGAEAEAREVARRVRGLLDAGVRPEGIGIVARDLAPYALLLARHFRRLGVPFSGVSALGGLEPAGRRARAMLDLLRRGEEAPADRWLDALGSRTPLRGGRLVDLRLAFSSLGAGRLRDVAELVIEPFLQDGSYPLPIRQGLRQAVAEEKGEETGDAGEVEDAPREAYAPRRRVDGKHLQAAVNAAGKLRGRLAGWPAQGRAGEHLRRLRALLTHDLGWEPDAGPGAPVLKALAELEEDVPAEFPLTREELQTLLGRALDGVGAAALGGHGGGVQVLTVTEARGRTFEHLFVPGLNRDLFPRGVREDPLLSDELRRVLQRVLPDVPIKRAGFDEERYLYAQLLAASPRLTLSWQAADADGKPCSPSPLLRGLGAEAKAPALFPRAPGPSTLRPADEHAVIAALHAPRPLFGAVLATALEEARTELLGEQESGIFRLRPADLAAVRVAVLDELDPDLRTPEGRAVRARLGPYFGFVGNFVTAAEGGADPRRMDLSITHLETLAGCPWQLFLVRLLKLEPTPDPLAALPGADPLLLGNTVHRVLERIVGVASETEHPPLLVSWPAASDLDVLMLDAAAQTLAAEGILLPGLARALAERARPYVEAAGAADWVDGVLPVLRAESKEEVEVFDAAGRGRPLRFRADRVDRSGRREGELRFTDYKTGRPVSTASKPDVRRRHFLNRVRAGTFLQAMAYLLAARDEPALGRYLYLRPEATERELGVASGDREFTAAFDRAVRAVLAAWDAGSFFPRLVDPAGRKEPARCGYCQVAEACLRGDSGARNRLFEWTGTARAEETSLAAPEQSLLAVWRLPAKEKEAAAENGDEGADA
jgi:superfamily I DNA/RNA helicase/RecB family exonuclease